MLVAVGFRNGQNAHNPDVTKNPKKSKMLLAAEKQAFLGRDNPLRTVCGS